METRVTRVCSLSLRSNTRHCPPCQQAPVFFLLFLEKMILKLSFVIKETIQIDYTWFRLGPVRLPPVSLEVRAVQTELPALLGEGERGVVEVTLILAEDDQ